MGCETAEWIYKPGKQITIVEIASDILNKMTKIPRERMLSRLQEKQIKILTETRLLSFENNTALLERKDDTKITIAADNLIVSIGSEPENNLLPELEKRIDQIIVIGDAKSPGNLGSGLRDATEAALAI
ncbi:NAD(P)/FAD-dependent oxidoreductase [bacterium]|nr:NAD(P)/FAD-dependent oxidoreductase [bacterium]